MHSNLWRQVLCQKFAIFYIIILFGRVSREEEEFTWKHFAEIIIDNGHYFTKSYFGNVYHYKDKDPDVKRRVAR